MTVSASGFQPTPAAVHNWVSFPAPRPQARLRLFCLPYGGGGTAAYFPWSRLLPPEVELCPIRLPGRENRLREAPYSQMEPLIAALAPSLTSLLDKPFTLFGHSMGAVVGFELLKRLEEQYGVKAVRFFASGRRAPHYPEQDPPMHHLPDSLLVAEVQKRYSGIPQVVLQDPDLLRLFLPTLRADMKLVETYQFSGGRLACPITALGGIQDSMVSEAGLKAWEDLTRAGFRLQRFPGGHFYLQTQTQALLQLMLDELPV